VTTTMRQDTWQNTISIDGGPAIVMDTFKGGDNDSASTTYRPGGMQKAKTIGGFSTVSNITLDKSMELETDWVLMSTLMRANVGRSRCVVSRHPMDPDGNLFGDPLVYTGVLKQVLPGDTDSNRADAQVWSVVVVPDSDIG
jgi:hypothetical protein